MRSKNERTPKERIEFLVNTLNARKEREREKKLKKPSPSKLNKKKEKEKKEEPPIVQQHREMVRLQRQKEKEQKILNEQRRKRAAKKLKQNTRIASPFLNRWITYGVADANDITREQLMEMENDEMESGRINWDKWDELIKIFRIQQCFQKKA